jgi:hypothetical protein
VNNTIAGVEFLVEAADQMPNLKADVEFQKFLMLTKQKFAALFQHRM